MLEGEEMHVVEYLIENSTNFIESGGIIFGFFLVFLECFIPALPLSVFVTLNINAFGFFIGILISWIATCIGSIICYLIFYFIGNKLTEKFLSKRIIRKVNKAVVSFKKIKFTELVLLITLPFTPSFLINIICGLSGMNKEKFILSIIIGKVFMVTFWGYIGKSLIDSLTDIKSIIFIGIALIIAYIISKIVSRKMNIE